MIDCIEIVKSTHQQIRFQSFDTLIKNKEEYQFYFYSLIKKKILRKKQDKMGQQFATDFVKKNMRKETPRSLIFINYKRRDDCKAVISIINAHEANRIVQNTKDHETWTFILLESKKESYQLIKAIWTENYCFCSQFQHELETSKQTMNLSVSVKQSIGIISMSISQSASKILGQQAKYIQTIFLKPMNSNKLYFLFCQKLTTESKTCLSLRFIQIQDKMKQELQSQETQIQQISRKQIICAACSKGALLFKQISQHNIYKIQLKHSTGKRSISQKRNSVSDMYNLIKICEQCYEKYLLEVKKQDAYLRSTQFRTNSVKLKNIPKVAMREKDNSFLFDTATQKIQIRKNKRVYSLVKTNSYRSESTKHNAFDSLIDASYISRKRN